MLSDLIVPQCNVEKDADALLLFSSRWDFLLRMCISSSAVISFKRNCNQMPFQHSRHLHVWCGKLYVLRLCVPASVCVPPVFELFISFIDLLRLYCMSK